MEESIATVKLSEVRKFVKKLEQTQKQLKKFDMDVPMELIMGSLFPDLLNNFKDKMTQSYIEGYNAGKKEAKDNE